MYLPIIDTFEKAEKIQKVNELEKTLHMLEATFEPFIGDVDTEPKQVDEHIQALRERNSSLTSDKTSNSASPYDKLQQYIKNVTYVVDHIESIKTNKNAFHMLYDNNTKIEVFYIFPPLFHMAQDFVNNTIQNLTYDSTYFNVDVVKNHGTHLPTLCFHTKPDKLEDVTDARKVLAPIYVSLTPDKENNTVMLKFYNPNLPNSYRIQETQNEAKALIKQMSSKYTKTPFWLRVLPKRTRESWNQSRKQHLHDAYNNMIRLKNDLKTFDRNLAAALQTEDVVRTRESIESDLRQYVNAINNALGTKLDIDVEYTRI